ncbi:MAG: phosphoribosylanthranilate isomerase [Alphaproteobacteria bacterium]|nr:phosphoribosylanthranilate isomerase [Alphaproteobacteria bacterium]MCL2505435.1 phosphoribosylanthranilate isomerase [Alphaproteobacteria bacterium]
MKLKICGLKTLQDIDCVNKANVDYAGFVFTPHRQQISVKTAKVLKAALSPKIKSVGVFVNEPSDFIKDIIDEGIIDLVQFHGDTEYEMPCPAIKAFRMRTKEDIKPTNCDFVLFDSFKEGTKGAAGEMFDWRLIEGYSEKPFFLAGGIDITNVKKAMELNPYCIDISSGVEENKEKSLTKIMEVAYECKIR